MTGQDALGIIRASCGGIAQLGERLHGMQEVTGSIPVTSTSDRALTFQRNKERCPAQDSSPRVPIV